MDASGQLLNEVVETARVGLDAVQTLLTKTDSPRMREELLREETDYQTIKRSAEDRLYQMGERPKAVNAFSRMGMKVGLNMDTLTDKSDAHFADMLIQGLTMGIIDITKAQGEYPEADGEAHGLANDLLNKSHEAIERAKILLTPVTA